MQQTVTKFNDNTPYTLVNKISIQYFGIRINFKPCNHFFLNLFFPIFAISFYKTY